MKRSIILITSFVTLFVLSNLCLGCSKNNEPCTVYGTINNSEGNPINGAKVEVSEGANKTITVTGLDGNYEASLTLDDNYVSHTVVISVDVSGFFSDSEMLLINPGEKKRCDFVLRERYY